MTPKGLLAVGSILPYPLISAMGWPGAVALLTGAVWFFARKSENFGMRMLARQLGPLALGFGADAAILLFLNLAQPNDPSRALSAADDFLMRVTEQVQRLSSLKLPVLVAFLLVALMINQLYPSWRLVMRFLFLRACVSAVLAFLVALTTFTILSDRPLRQWPRDNHEAVRHRFYAAVRRQAHQGAREVLEEMTISSLQHMSEPQKRQLRNLAHVLARIPEMDTGEVLRGSPSHVTIEIRFRGVPDYYEDLICAIGESYGRETGSDPDMRAFASAVLFPEPATAMTRSAPGEPVLDRIPTTLMQWRSDRALVGQQETRAQARKEQADQAWAGVAAVVSEVVKGLIGPLPNNLPPAVGAFLDGTINGALESVPDRSVNWWNRTRAAAGVTAVVSRARMLVASNPDMVKDLFLAAKWKGMDSAGVEARVVSEMRGVFPSQSKKPRITERRGSREDRLRELIERGRVKAVEAAEGR